MVPSSQAIFSYRFENTEVTAMTNCSQLFLLLALFALMGFQHADGQPANGKPKPLMEAIEKHDFAKVREMYKQDPQCLYELFNRQAYQDSYLRLRMAIEENDKKAVLDVLQGEIDVNMPMPASHDLPISMAILAGNLEMVKLFVEHGSVVDAVSEDCTPPFVLAVQTGNLDILKFLVEKGAKLSFSIGKDMLLQAAQNNLDVFKYVLSLDIGGGNLPYGGNTALHLVGNADAVDILLAAGYDPNKKNDAGLTPLDCAIQNAHYQKIKRLIAHGVDRKGRHFLNWAVFSDDLEMAQKLLDEGEDINRPNSANCTILYDIFNQDYQISQETREKNARWLMAHGADVTRGNLSSWEGHAPSSLYAIAAHGSVDLLKEAMGKVDAEKIRELYAWDLVVGAASTGNLENLMFVLKELDANKIARAILDEAMNGVAQNNSLEMIRLLLKQGASANGKSNSWLPIYIAIEYGHPEAAKLLVDNGANVNAQFFEHGTPLMEAVKYDFSDLVEYLLEHGADVHGKSIYGLTALHVAAKTGNVAIMKRLLAAGADKDAVNAMKQKPIDVAASEGNPPAFRLLLGLYDKKERNALLDKALELAFRHTQRNMVLNILEHDETEDDATAVVDDGALRQAVLASDAKKVKELVEKGADVNAVDGDGNTILDLAFKLRTGSGSSDGMGTKKRDIVNCLIDHDAKLGKTKPTLFVDRYWMTFDGKLMDYMLKNGADINEEYHPNVRTTMVAILARNRDIPLLKRLIEAGADVNYHKNGASSPLEFVIERQWDADEWNEWIAVVKCLLEHGADVNIGQPIVHAVEGKKYDAALIMLDYCKEITVKDKHEEAMFLAIVEGRTDVAQKLAKFLPKTDKTMANAEAYLRRLAFEGNVVGMERLIEATGVGLNGKDKENDTALFYAMEGRKMDAVMYLINHGADIKAIGCGDETLLHCAVKLDLGLVKYLVEHGLDVNAKNKAGITPLHHATGRFAVVAYLLEHGADVNVTATDGMPLAVCASLIATEETLKALGEKGMDFKAKTKDGFTAMHAAAAANPAVVPYLRSLGLPELSEEDVKKAKKRFIENWADHESIHCGNHVWAHQHILFYD